MSYKTYDEYKNSGIEWIGEIPCDWNVFKLKHVVSEFISGGTPKSSNDAFWDENNEGIPWIAISDMTDNDFINSTAKSLTEEGIASKSLRILKKGTLIYSIFASLGKVSILNIPATTNQAILGIVTSNKINKFYLKFYLEALREHIISFSNANTQENLNSTTVKNIEIILPSSINEQNLIVNFLDKKTLGIDKNIAKSKELISLLEEKKTALINQVVTKGLNPNVPMKDSGIEWIGDMPDHWRLHKLKRYANLNNGKEIENEVSFDDENAINVYGSGGVFKYTDKYMFNGESVLFGRKGTIGKPVYVNEKFWTVDTMYYLTFYNSLIPKYCFYSLTFYPWDKITTNTAKPSIVGSDITNSSFVIPPKEEQSRIVDYLDNEINKIDQVIGLVNDQIELLEEYKSSLIHHVVTGKIDVREEVI